MTQFCTSGATCRPALLAFILLFGAACDDSVITSSDNSTSRILQSRSDDTSEQSLHTIDDQFLWVAEQVPAFAGAYIDEEGILIIQVTDLSQRSEAEARVRTISQRQRIALAPTRSVLVKYSFKQLAQWRNGLRDAVSLPQMVSVDLDEVSNRIRFGVATEEAIPALQEFIARSAVPVGAIEIDVRGFPSDEKTLRDHLYPHAGGIKIKNDNGLFGDKECTLGFNAVFILSGIVRYGFFTATHCTDTWGGGPDGSSFFQPDLTHFMGVEVQDPPYHTQAQNIMCPSGKLCRWSDSALIEYVGPSYSHHGHIARTLGPNSNFHTISGVVNGTTFRIYGEGPVPLVGEPVHKMGMETGWTSGYVTATCVNHLAGNPANWYYYCQNEASYTSAGGDSGAPIFDYDNNGDTENVPILGIHRAALGSTRIYSPIWNIHQDHVGYFLPY